jgi:mRNA turnover protein 4
MAKSKRNKEVALTKVGKKNHVSDKKSIIVEKIQKYLNEYEYYYAFRYKNMTTMAMQSLRNYWNNDKFVIGKNKVIQVALGRTEEEEQKPNSHKLSAYLKGNCGLFFSNDEPDKIIE